MKISDSAGRCACHKYCHLARRDCSNTSTKKEYTHAAIISISESGEDSPQASTKTPSLPRAQPPKVTKRHRTNTTSPRKQGKFDAQAIAEIKDALGADEGCQTTLSQYAISASVDDKGESSKRQRSGKQR